MADQHSKKSEPLVQLPDVEKIEEEIKSAFYELRNGKVWFSKEIKREHRRLKTSLVRYVLHSRILAILTAPFIYAVIIPFVLAGSVRLRISSRLLSRLRHTQSAPQGLHRD